MSVDIFFDLVGVHGNAALANELWRSAFDVAQGNVTFAKLLAEAAGEVESGVNFRTENGRIDLKKAGLFGIVTTARVLAIRHHLLERSTPARLSAVAGLGRGGGSDLDALARVHGELLGLILEQQLADMHDGLPPCDQAAVASNVRVYENRCVPSATSIRSHRTFCSEAEPGRTDRHLT